MPSATESFADLRIADSKGRVLLGARYAGKRFAVHEKADGTAILTPVVVVPEREKPLTAQAIAEGVAWLETLKENWDGHDSLAPAPSLVAYAREVIALLYAGALARNLYWFPPHIGVNERGQITLEWWRKERDLAVFIRAEGQIEYLKAWGSNIETEMEDGELSRLDDFAALSRWLYQEEAANP